MHAGSLKSIKNKWKWGVQAIVVLLGAAIVTQPAWPADADAAGADSANSSVASATNSDPKQPSAGDFQHLEQLLEQQSAQLQQLTRELQDQQAKTAALEAKVNSSPGPAANARSVVAASFTPPANAANINAAASVGAAAIAPTAAATPLQQNAQPNVISAENPLSIKIGGANFTPGGFVDLTGIFRSADVGSGLGTNFTNLPYNNTLPLGRLSEFRFTGQGTRLSLKVDAQPTKNTAVTGYFESDFNGFEPANSNISTKSDSFRLRLAFVQLRHGKWEIVTGQTWTLLTPTRSGLSPFPENIFTALRLDTSYLAGLVYDRQPGFRVVYHATNAWALGVALENPQQFAPSSVVFPTDGATNFFSQQFDNGSSSTSAASSAVNPTVPNLHPDIVAKTSLDWKWGGKAFHLDADGVARTFKVVNNLVAPIATNAVTGGGGGVNANIEPLKNFHLIGNSFYGDGVGRYIGGLGPDVIVRPNGSLSAVHAGSGVAGFEWQTTPKLIVDGYYSGAYFWRNYERTTAALGTPCSVAPGAACVGFGFPGSANTNNKSYQEATLGFIPTIWSSPNYGRLQFISQFSYVVRAPWFVAPGQPKNAHIFISYVNLRYILP